MVLLGVFEGTNDPECLSPSLVKPKPIKNRRRFLSGFRNINKQLKQKPYTMTKINEMLFKLEGFPYDASLDLNMGYYPIELSKNASDLCKIIPP